MGAAAEALFDRSIGALLPHDPAQCDAVVAVDEGVDRLNRGMLTEVLAPADDKAMLEWGIAMHVVAREIERVGDHAVDIGEQVAFLVTGEFAEFTDASHPEIERATLRGHIR